MVRTLLGIAHFNVTVTAQRETGSTVICAQHDMLASDAFDYAAQALGYFRFAIQDMDCRSIEIEVRRGTDVILETIEITRD